MTAYLWETVLQKDSFLDILQKFISYQKEVKKKTLPDGKVRTDTAEKIIFPRYHQLDVVRKLVHHTREHGPGHTTSSSTAPVPVSPTVSPGPLIALPVYMMTKIGLFITQSSLLQTGKYWIVSCKTPSTASIIRWAAWY